MEPRQVRSKALPTKQLVPSRSGSLNLGRTAALTVEHGHLALVVASACCCAWRHCALDGSEVILAELQLESADRFRQPITSCGTHQGDDVLAAGKHPGDRDLGDGHALRLGDGAQSLDEDEVAFKVLPAESRHVGAHITG